MLHDRPGGSTRNLVDTTSAAIVDGPNHYTVEVVGPNIKFWANGSLVFNYADNTVPYASGASPIVTGGVGVYWFWETVGWADNVVVTNLR